MTSETSSTSTTDGTTDGTTTAPDDTAPVPAALGDDQAGIAPTARKAKGTKSFADVGVHPDLVEALTAKGFDAPFPIQELTLPIATKGHDVIGQARTGTGKTLAFGLALLGRVTPGGGTQALVIVPTRELCIQVADELQIGKGRGLRVIAVYGGVGYEEQEAAFDGGHEVVVGTPGRLLDHVNKGNLDLSGVTELVLDEADEMLDMGFLPDVERLIQACRDDRHGMLFSATMPTEVVKLARRYLDHPTFMRADTEALETAPNVEQHFFQVHRMDKPRVLARILQSPERGGVYVFVRTKHMADRLVRELEDLGTAAIAIHGDLRQSMREKNLDKFRDGSATVLVATEVAARGLDVENVTHVINYDCPDDEKMYLHRIGRTARAGAKGVAVTFCEFNEVDRLNVIRKKVGAVDVAVEPVFSPSEILTERFDLPAERPWDAQVAGAKAGTHTDRRKPDGDGDRRDGRGGRGGKGDGRGAKGDGGRGAKGSGGRGAKVDAGDRGDGDRATRGAKSDAGGRGDGDRAPRGDGDRTSRDEPRTSRTDGRPKSTRRAEGGGNDRDADRARRDRSRQARATAPTTEADAAGATDARGDAGGEGASDEGGTRTRVRARTRARSGSDRTRDDRTGGDHAGGADSSARGGDDGRDQDRPEARGGARVRDRQARPRSPDADRDRSRRGGGDADTAREPRGGRDRGRSRGGSSGGGDTDARGDAGTGGGRGEDRGRSNGDRSRSTGDRSRNGGGDRGGRRDEGGRDRGGRNRSGRGRGRDDDRGGDAGGTPTPVARRGREARGEGSPALARRVHVEHLP